MQFQTDASFADKLDLQDPLQGFRQQFIFSDPDEIYLDGNSLGMLSHRAQKVLRDVIDKQWAEFKIRSWNTLWFHLPQRIGEKIGRLIGAQPGEVLISDSTTVNLFKLAVAALRAQPGKNVIVTDELNFPSDIYILQGLKAHFFPQLEIRIVSSRDQIYIHEQDLAKAIDEQTALVYLSHVTFKSGFAYNLQRVNELVHRKGALVLWDVSHSVGALPLQVDATGVDLAVGCTYKYLNGGPGAPAFLYIRQSLQNKLANPITGWFGHKQPFDFSLQFSPAEGIKQFLVGTPPILSLAAVEPAIELLLEAGMEKIREKSILQTEYFRYLWHSKLREFGFKWRSPEAPEQRGSHIALAHPDGFRITRALIETKKVITDFRSPDLIRFAFAPLYTSFKEIYEAVFRLEQIMKQEIHLNYPDERPPVT